MSLIKERITILENQLDDHVDQQRQILQALATHIEKLEAVLGGASRHDLSDLRYDVETLMAAVKRLIEDHKPKCLTCRQVLSEPEYNASSPLGTRGGKL